MLKKLSILLLLCPLFGFGQQAHPILADFFGYQNQEALDLVWTIKSGNTCQGISIQRFDEASQTFVEVGQYDGICGSTTSNERYEFKDTSPLPNQVNLYRLVLGQQGNTNVLSVSYFNLNKMGYTILGNPLVEQSSIIFENPLHMEHEFVLFDMAGRKVYSTFTTSNKIPLFKNNLQSGNYIFQIISNNGHEIAGKLNIQ